MDSENLMYHLETSILNKYNIEALLVAGSVVYRDKTSNTKVRDWDGLIVCTDRSDLLSLLQDPTPCATLLGVEEDESQAEICKHLVNLPAVDAVRFSGYTMTGLKKSVKIVYVGCLTNMVLRRNSTYLNVRVYQVDNFLSSAAWCFQFQPATSLRNGVCVLHDPDIYCTDITRAGVRYARFGIIIDEFLSGQWVFLRSESTLHLMNSLSRRFMEKFGSVPNIWIPSNWTSVFARSIRFSITYREKLEAVDWAPNWIPGPSSKEPRREVLLLFGPSVLQEQKKFFGLGNLGLNCPPEPSYANATRNFTSWEELGTTLFCKNRRGTVTSSAPNGVATKLFWKESGNVSDEILGAHRVSKVYKKTKVPYDVDFENRILFYPWFEGQTVSELRFILATGVENNTKQLFSIEMVRAEDILRGHLATISTRKPDSRIQKYYRGRLLNYVRLKSFYGRSGVRLQDGRLLSYEEFVSTGLEINGRLYPALKDILDNAFDALEHRDGDLTVLGLGDSHGGNVMVKSKGTNTVPELLYVDYDSAGWHSPWIDLAKPFYNDIFFDIFYADGLDLDLYGTGIVRAQRTENKLQIEFKVPDSDVTKGIWEIKRRFLLDPLTSHESVKTAEDWKAKLGNALLCCAILTRDFGSRSDILLANLAVGVAMTDWYGWTFLR